MKQLKVVDLDLGLTPLTPLIRGARHVGICMKKCLFIIFLSGVLVSPAKATADSGSTAGSSASLHHAVSPLSPADKEALKRPAKGLILAFKLWPLSEPDKSALLKKAESKGLTEKVHYSHFKTYVFEWEGWQTKAQAEKACESFLDFPELDYCEPDLLQKPHTGKIRKKRSKRANKKARKRTLEKARERNVNKLGTKKEEPQSNIKLNPLETFPADKSGDLRSCQIVSSTLNLKEGELSDYWAQEMIGSDLMREELKLQPPVKKHLVAVFDTPHYSSRHDIASRNIISGSGKQAVLPEIGNSITNFDVTLGGYSLGHSNYLLNTAKQRCQAYSSSSQGGKGRAGTGSAR